MNNLSLFVIYFGYVLPFIINNMLISSISVVSFMSLSYDKKTMKKIIYIYKKKNE